MPTTTPTEAALKCAGMIASTVAKRWFSSLSGIGLAAAIRDLAEKIDRETALPQLIAACKALVAATRDCGYDCRQGDVMDAVKLAKAALVAAAPDAKEGAE